MISMWVLTHPWKDNWQPGQYAYGSSRVLSQFTGPVKEKQFSVKGPPLLNSLMCLGTLGIFPFVFTSLWGRHLLMSPILQVSKLRVAWSHKANSQSSSWEGTGCHQKNSSFGARENLGSNPGSTIFKSMLLNKWRIFGASTSPLTKWG